MPMEGLNRISNVQLQRIRVMTGNFANILLDKSLNQLKYEYAKAMNKMIFSKHIEGLSQKLLGTKISQPFLN